MPCKLTDTLTLNSGRCHTWAGQLAKLMSDARRSAAVDAIIPPGRWCHLMWLVSAGRPLYCTARRLMLLLKIIHYPSVCPCEACCSCCCCCCCYNGGGEESQQHLAPAHPLLPTAACGVQPAVMTISVWLRLLEITGDLRPCTSTQPERNGRLPLISLSAILHTLLH